MWSEWQSAFCKNCGQTCTPERYTRPAEWYDATTRQVQDWRSPCCHDQLSEDPVSDQCDMCGATVDCSVPDQEMEKFVLADGDLMCPACLADYRRDHPDWEAVVEEAEARADSREDR